MKINKIIQKIKKGELLIEAMTSGFFIYRPDGEDIESYSIIPFNDDPEKDWYLLGDGSYKILTPDEVKKFQNLLEY